MGARNRSRSKWLKSMHDKIEEPALGRRKATSKNTRRCRRITENYFNSLLGGPNVLF